MNNTKVYGYHLSEIPKGVFGNASKIIEECLEFQDAVIQKNDILALVELADLYGAIQGYLAQHHPSITMESLRGMNNATARAFQVGERK